MLMRRIAMGVAVVLCGALLAMLAAAGVETEKGEPADADATEEVRWAPAVEPKALSDNAKRGLAWLQEHQLKNGAWGQGEESTQMGGGAAMKDAASVGDTCVAALALLRSGSTAAKGPYANSISRAVGFVCREVENSDKDSLWITSTRGTRIQSKLGQNIDTFMACMLLSEVKDTMPDKLGNQHVADALDKVLHKMKVNQKDNGTWGDQGWAPALAMSMASKGYNRAAQNGAKVDEKVREKAEEYARQQHDAKTGKFKADGSAGVALYAAASSVSAQSDSSNTNGRLEAEAREKLRSAKTSGEREEAQKELDRYDQAKKDLQQAQQAVVARLDDKQFIAGFGSNGGEEFLSYMNIGESLVVKGGDAWKKWDKEIAENLNRIQNKDGSWSGHHCITGRTFCTSGALLVLMVDRSPVPIAAKMARR